MINIPFLKKLTVAFVAVFFASCDKDYNTLGSDIVGNENFNFTHESFKLNAYNQKVPVVQTNNLPINQLGILKNDVFGKTKANFVTQLSLATLKPIFTSGVVVDSVVLSVPYFSHKTKTESNGHGIYELDSINSSNPATDPVVYDPINLKVFRNGYYLNDQDPNTDLATSQRFFSNQDVLFSGNTASGILNNDANTAENSSFIPSAKEIVIFKRDATTFVPTTDVESRIKPSMRLHLDKTHFEDEIIDKAIAPATADEFENNNIFKTKYKGLYFQVEDAPSGSLMTMDFSKGTVTIYYRQDKANTTPVVKEMKSLVLNLTGNTVNLLDNTGGSTGYVNAVSDPNEAAELYLKGGEGSMAFIDLFSDPAEFALLKDQGVLINDASLTFTVKNLPGLNNKNPQRIYIFDAEKNTPLYDFYFDNSESSNPKRNRFIHGGLKVVKDNGLTTTYKVRITEHVSRILKEKISDLNPVPKLNIRLGVVVTESINTVLNSYLQDQTILVGGKKFDRLPVASVMNPLGVVFYGSNILPTDPDYDKRIKFEIYYTKPN
jgi:hypothetical protein